MDENISHLSEQINSVWFDKLKTKKEKSSFFSSFLISVVIFIFFYVIADNYKTLIIDPEKEKEKDIKNGSNGTKINKNLLYHQMNRLIYYIILGIGMSISLVNVGFNIATILTILGTVGLAIGLALQETLRNVISGIYVTINGLFKIGDVITVQQNINDKKVEGVVIDFNLYYTTIAVKDSDLVSMVPNSIIQNNIVTKKNTVLLDL